LDFLINPLIIIFALLLIALFTKKKKTMVKYIDNFIVFICESISSN